MIYLLRHGETSWNVAGRKQGRGDSPLTDRGVAQVEACARAIRSLISDTRDVEIHASPLGRARTSAEIVRRWLRTAHPLRLDGRLSEYDYGKWEGLTDDEIRSRFPTELAERERDKWNRPAPGGESYRLVAERVESFLDEYDRRSLRVVVTHEVVSRVMRGLYLALDPSEITHLNHPHATIFCLSGGEVRELRPAEGDSMLANTVPDIRRAEAPDAAAIHQCVTAAYQHYIARLGKPPGPMLDDYSLVVEEHEVFVAEHNGVVVGVLVLIGKGSGWLLDNVAVDPKYQGRGIGRLLLEFAETRTRQRGYPYLDLYTHASMTENIAMYERAGYLETGRRVERGYDRVYMRKSL